MARFLGKKSLSKSHRNKTNRLRKSIEFYNDQTFRSNLSIELFNRSNFSIEMFNRSNFSIEIRNHVIEL